MPSPCYAVEPVLQKRFVKQVLITHRNLHVRIELSIFKHGAERDFPHPSPAGRTPDSEMQTRLMVLAPDIIDGSRRCIPVRSPFVWQIVFLVRRQVLAQFVNIEAILSTNPCLRSS